MKLKELVVNSFRARSKKKNGLSSGADATPDFPAVCYSANKNRKWLSASISRAWSSRDHSLRDQDLSDANWQGNALYQGLMAERVENLASGNTASGCISNFGDIMTSEKIEGVSTHVMTSRSCDSRVVVSEGTGSCSKISSITDLGIEPYSTNQQYYYRSSYASHKQSKALADLSQSQLNVVPARIGVHQLNYKPSEVTKPEASFFRKSLASFRGKSKRGGKTNKSSTSRELEFEPIRCYTHPYTGVVTAPYDDKNSTEQGRSKTKKKLLRGFGRSKENNEIFPYSQEYCDRIDIYDSESQGSSTCNTARPHSDISMFSQYELAFSRESTIRTCSSNLYESRRSSALRETDFAAFDSASLSGYESDLSRCKVQKSRSRIKTNPWLPSPQLSQSSGSRSEFFGKTRFQEVECGRRFPRSSSYDSPRKDNNAYFDLQRCETRPLQTHSNCSSRGHLNPRYLKGNNCIPAAETGSFPADDFLGRNSNDITMKEPFSAWDTRLDDQAMKPIHTAAIRSNDIIIATSCKSDFPAKEITMDETPSTWATPDNNIAKRKPHSKTILLANNTELSNLHSTLINRPTVDFRSKGNNPSNDIALTQYSSTKMMPSNDSSKCKRNKKRTTLNDLNRVVSPNKELSSLANSLLQFAGRLGSNHKEVMGSMNPFDYDESQKPYKPQKVTKKETNSKKYLRCGNRVLSSELVSGENEVMVIPTIHVTSHGDATSVPTSLADSDSKVPFIDCLPSSSSIDSFESISENDVSYNLHLTTTQQCAYPEKETMLGVANTTEEYNCPQNLLSPKVYNYETYPEAPRMKHKKRETRDIEEITPETSFESCDELDSLNSSNISISDEDACELINNHVSKVTTNGENAKISHLQHENSFDPISPQFQPAYCHIRVHSSVTEKGDPAYEYILNLGTSTSQRSVVNNAFAISNPRPYSFKTTPFAHTSPGNNLETCPSKMELDRLSLDKIIIPRNISMFNCADSPTDNRNCDDKFSISTDQTGMFVSSSCQDKVTISNRVQEVASTENAHCTETYDNDKATKQSTVSLTTATKIISECMNLNQDKLATRLQERHMEMSDVCIQTDFDDDYASLGDVFSYEDNDLDPSENTGHWLMTGSDRNPEDAGYPSLARHSLTSMDEDALFLAGELEEQSTVEMASFDEQSCTEHDDNLFPIISTFLGDGSCDALSFEKQNSWKLDNAKYMTNNDNEDDFTYGEITQQSVLRGVHSPNIHQESVPHQNFRKTSCHKFQESTTQNEFADSVPHTTKTMPQSAVNLIFSNIEYQFQEIFQQIDDHPKVHHSKVSHSKVHHMEMHHNNDAKRMKMDSRISDLIPSIIGVAFGDNISNSYISTEHCPDSNIGGGTTFSGFEYDTAYSGTTSGGSAYDGTTSCSSNSCDIISGLNSYSGSTSGGSSSGGNASGFYSAGITSGGIMSGTSFADITSGGITSDSSSASITSGDVTSNGKTSDISNNKLFSEISEFETKGCVEILTEKTDCFHYACSSSVGLQISNIVTPIIDSNSQPFPKGNNKFNEQFTVQNLQSKRSCMGLTRQSSFTKLDMRHIKLSSMTPDIDQAQPPKSESKTPLQQHVSTVPKECLRESSSKQMHILDEIQSICVIPEINLQNPLINLDCSKSDERLTHISINDTTSVPALSYNKQDLQIDNQLHSAVSYERQLFDTHCENYTCENVLSEDGNTRNLSSATTLDVCCDNNEGNQKMYQPMTTEGAKEKADDLSPPEVGGRSLADRVMSLRNEKDKIFQKILEVKHVEMTRHEQMMCIQRTMQTQRQEALLNTVRELKDKLEEQRRHLNMKGIKPDTPVSF